jgi:putative N6-adenine-specific DNA methylase
MPAVPKPETFPFFTPAVPGLEPLLLRELLTLGLHPIAEDGGYFWRGTWREFYRAQLMLRTAGRVLVRIKEFESLTFADFERQAADLPYARFLEPGQGFKLKVSCAKSKLYHEDALAERLAGWITKATGSPWRPEASDADAQIFIVRGWHDRFTISADGSGEHLHRRGYRQEVSKAPLRETIAASLLCASGWIPSVEEGTGRGAAVRYKVPSQPLTDPFCGSGTIVLEAALAARKIPPAMANPKLNPRPFSFWRWPSFDADEFTKTVESLRSKVLDKAPMELRGSDRDDGAVAAAWANAQRAGLEADVSFERRALADARLPDSGFVVTNPPFGVRVSEGKDLRDLYAVLGRRAAEAPGRRTAWLCADPEFERAAGGSWIPVHRFPNGGLDLTIVLR